MPGKKKHHIQFASRAQMRAMFSQAPAVAKRWAKRAKAAGVSFVSGVKNSLRSRRKNK